MKKFLLSLVACIVLAVPVFAYEFPDESYYVVLDTGQYGQLTIYIPVNTSATFSPMGDSIVNVGSSVVTGYTEYSGSESQVRFPVYDNPEFRQSTTGYTWTEITDAQLVETNLPLLNDTSFSLLSQDTVIQLIILLIGGLILCHLFMK